MPAVVAKSSVKVTIRGVRELTQRYDRMPELVRQALIREVTDLTFELFERARRRASGDVLKVLTGRYLRSLKPRITIGEARVRGVLSSVGLGRRAGFLEFGGKAKPRLIEAKKVNALHFLRGGAEVFAKVVHHPGPKIGPHPVIYGAFNEMQGEIAAGLEAAVKIGSDA